MTKKVFVCTLTNFDGNINYILDIFESVPTKDALDLYLRHNYALTITEYPDEHPFRYGKFKFKFMSDMLTEVFDGDICEHTVADYKTDLSFY